MSPKDVHDLMPGTCEDMVLHGKGELRVQINLRVQIKSSDLEMGRLWIIQGRLWIIQVDPV